MNTGTLTKAVTGIIVTIIGFIIVFNIMAGQIGDVQSAGNEVNATGAPLAGLYAGDGVLILLFMAAVFLGLMAWGFRASKG